jgi:2'-hydroxyisoflavone reductase
MRLLVLGGTRFLGRGIVDAALERGADVTTFTRGQSGEAPQGVEALHGDRNTAEGLAVLRGREWDVVVDTSGYVPWIVGESAKLLADQVGHYVFVSTMNVYSAWGDEPITAGSPVFDTPADAGPKDGEWDVHQYGPFKAGCERAVDEHFAGRSTHVRSGLIIGRYDNSGRLPWWVRRIAAGGEVLAPGEPDRDFRALDYRDLGAWCVHCGQSKVVGAYPATGPAGQATMGGLFAEIRAATGSDADFTWVEDKFLFERGLTPWVTLPLWLPPAAAKAMWQEDTSAAEANGLTARPLAETITDTADWVAGLAELPVRTTGGTVPPGLEPDREAELLAQWRDRA